jgi:hypothetical protein
MDDNELRDIERAMEAESGWPTAIEQEGERLSVVCTDPDGQNWGVAFDMGSDGVFDQRAQRHIGDVLRATVARYSTGAHKV